MDTAEIDGLRFVFTTPGEREQFEIECILAQLLAPGAAAGVGLLAEALAAELVKLLREVTLDETLAADEADGVAPAAWDLGRLLHLRDHMSTTDPRLKKAWDGFIDAIPGLAGQLIADLTPEVSDRLEHEKLARLFELTVIGHAHVVLEGVPTKITDFRSFRLHCNGRWTLKYQVMLAALVAVYLAPDEAAEPEGDASEAA
jgi:hypothetical protein